MLRLIATAFCLSLLASAAGATTPVGGRVSATEKGSLLVYSKVEIKWDAQGQVIQDTFLDIANDYPDDVIVQMYFVNGDAPAQPVFVGNPPMLVERGHPGWNWVDCQMMLTKDQPTYWSVLTGANTAGGVCQPFTILDPGTPPGRPDPDGPAGQRVLRGFVYAFAVDNYGQEIRWNHLKGDAVILNYLNTAAWEYNAYAFQAVTATHALASDPVPGQLMLDGVEYDQAFDMLLLDFYASGSTAMSVTGTTVQLDTELILFPVSQDFRQDGYGPVATKAKFDIWNMNEMRFSGTERCISCWDQALLSKYTSVANHFMRQYLQTDKGKARIDGVASALCSKSADAALLGTAAKILVFSGARTGTALTGTTLVGQGTQSAGVFFDLIEPPGELVVPGNVDDTITEEVEALDDVAPKAIRNGFPGGR